MASARCIIPAATEGVAAPRSDTRGSSTLAPHSQPNIPVVQVLVSLLMPTVLNHFQYVLSLPKLTYTEYPRNKYRKLEGEHCGPKQ
jgi:hypothetical protein